MTNNTTGTTTNPNNTSTTSVPTTVKTSSVQETSKVTSSPASSQTTNTTQDMSSSTVTNATSTAVPSSSSRVSTPNTSRSSTGKGDGSSTTTSTVTQNNTTSAATNATSTVTSIPISTSTSAPAIITGLMKEQICSQERQYFKPTLCNHTEALEYCIFTKNNATYDANNTRVTFEALCNKSPYKLYDIPKPENVTDFYDRTVPTQAPIIINKVNGDKHYAYSNQGLKTSQANTRMKCFCNNITNLTEIYNSNCRCYPTMIGELSKKEKRKRKHHGRYARDLERFVRDTHRSGHGHHGHHNGHKRRYLNKKFYCSSNLIDDKYCNLTRNGAEDRWNVTCDVTADPTHSFHEVDCHDTKLETLLKSTLENDMASIINDRQLKCLDAALDLCPAFCKRYGGHTSQNKMCHVTCRSVCTSLCQMKYVIQSNFNTVIDQLTKNGKLKHGTLNATEAPLTTESTTTEDHFDPDSYGEEDEDAFFGENPYDDRRKIEEYIYERLGGDNNSYGMVLSEYHKIDHMKLHHHPFFKDLTIMISLACLSFVMLIIIGISVVFFQNRKYKHHHQKLDEETSSNGSNKKEQTKDDL